MKHPTLWLTDQDLARRYSVSRMTVWRWAKSGRLPKPQKIGPNTTRWNAAEVDRFDERALNGKAA